MTVTLSYVELPLHGDTCTALGFIGAGDAAQDAKNLCDVLSKLMPAEGSIYIAEAIYSHLGDGNYIYIVSDSDEEINGIIAEGFLHDLSMKVPNLILIPTSEIVADFPIMQEEEEQIALQPVVAKSGYS